MRYIVSILCAFGAAFIFGLICDIFRDIPDNEFFRTFCATVSMLGGYFGYENSKR